MSELDYFPPEKEPSAEEKKERRIKFLELLHFLEWSAIILIFYQLHLTRLSVTFGIILLFYSLGWCQKRKWNSEVWYTIFGVICFLMIIVAVCSFGSGGESIYGDY